MSAPLVRILVELGAEPTSAQRAAMFLNAGCTIAEAAEWLEPDDYAIEDDPELMLFEALLTEKTIREAIEA